MRSKVQGFFNRLGCNSQVCVFLFLCFLFTSSPATLKTLLGLTKKTPKRIHKGNSVQKYVDYFQG